MPKYRVKYVYENWYDLDIEAESEEQAREIFYAGEFETDPTPIGGQIQEVIDIEELEEATV